eukprot:GHVU01105758.1.p2 GENE.GHVU01105758.1~~GHVU01105758.1.p2  ORF type:complete len:103 (+),score=8.28 GHVU01105758.1:83-391(+)
MLIFQTIVKTWTALYLVTQQWNEEMETHLEHDYWMSSPTMKLGYQQPALRVYLTMGSKYTQWIAPTIRMSSVIASIPADSDVSDFAPTSRVAQNLTGLPCSA